MTGGGGAELYPVDPSPRLAHGASLHHFVRRRANARRLLLEAIDLEGKVFDSIAIEK